MNNIQFLSLFSESHRIKQCCPHHRCVVLTDENVGRHYAQPLLEALQSQGLLPQLITVPAGESTKSRQMKAWIEDKLFQSGYGRDTVIIALGGGVITDLAGFVAATYCRGIPVIYIPTSLLAMVDAAIGGKTGINTAYGKNTLGTITHPQAVFIDITLLNTLPETDYNDAFSEIIKHALIYDENYLSLIESTAPRLPQRPSDCLLPLIKRSCEIKSAVVSGDETEQGQRESLNFGHTIGHALERVSDYRLTHGKAVAVGLTVESYLSYQLGLLTLEAFHRIQSLVLTLIDLEGVHLAATELDIVQSLLYDKKRRQQQCRWVLLSSIGQVKVDGAHYAHSVNSLVVKKSIDYLLSCCWRQYP